MSPSHASDEISLDNRMALALSLSRLNSKLQGAPVSETTTRIGLSDNAISALSYVTFVPAVVFLVLPPYNQSSTVRFHAWQSIFLAIAWIALWVVIVGIGGISAINVIDLFLIPVVQIAGLVVLVLLALRALNGKRTSLPVVGPLAAKLAGE
jgi:uncharacterized membrane protein